jgi:hypothetical protein
MKSRRVENMILCQLACGLAKNIGIEGNDGKLDVLSLSKLKNGKVIIGSPVAKYSLSGASISGFKYIIFMAASPLYNSSFNPLPLCVASSSPRFEVEVGHKGMRDANKSGKECKIVAKTRRTCRKSKFLLYVQTVRKSSSVSNQSGFNYWSLVQNLENPFWI